MSRSFHGKEEFIKPVKPLTQSPIAAEWLIQKFETETRLIYVIKISSMARCFFATDTFYYSNDNVTNHENYSLPFASF